jgi:Ran GTPase-activating protein (RanGAP) involved in mRNA processing and transport
MKYICTTKDCIKEGVIVIEPSITITVRDGNTFVKEAMCPYCKKIRNEVDSEPVNFRDKGVMIAQQFGSVNKKWSTPNKNSIY